MKKLIIIAAMLVTLNSCEKCGTCTTTTTTTISPSLQGYPQTTTMQQDLCGSDYKEADGKTSTAKTKSGNYWITATSKCECN